MTLTDALPTIANECLKCGPGTLRPLAGLVLREQDGTLTTVDLPEGHKDRAFACLACGGQSLTNFPVRLANPPKPKED